MRHNHKNGGKPVDPAKLNRELKSKGIPPHRRYNILRDAGVCQEVAINLILVDFEYLWRR